MTKRDSAFSVGDWHHCYNHSIDRHTAFADTQDYDRFLELLYLANDESPLRRNDIGIRKLEEVLMMPRGKNLVAIAAFCLMPARFHLALREIREGGITSFMRKLGTAYALYFNSRYERKGNLFLKPFQSNRVSSDRQLVQMINYVHANPAELYEPEWKTGHVVDHQFVGEHLVAYPYSSLRTYAGFGAATSSILDKPLVVGARSIPIQKMLYEARQYAFNTNIP
jgi:putative transposase